MNYKRKSGILLHITSLPGRWGMGEMGPEARKFAEFLEAAGQKLWQILPTGPVGYASSPYSSPSAFAGNHLLISFDDLIEEGLLSEKDLTDFPEYKIDEVEFPEVNDSREKVLFALADRFESTPEFDTFLKAESAWLSDYTLFMALRGVHGCRAWTEWPEGVRDRDFQSLEDAREKYAILIRRHEVLQYLFSKHWKKLTTFCHGKGIKLIGDIPIFVSGDSVDVWANRELFFLKPDGNPTVIAGVPPDYFSEVGQRWGNPLYDWAAHRASAYKWWTERMQRMFEMVDIVRIDHFRGFAGYWEIPAENPTAAGGQWVKGPGLELFQALEKNLKNLPMFGKKFCLADHVIAENLGVITDDVEQLREDCDFPGMWILQFRFGAMDMNKPNNVPEGVEENWTVYSGTHDNETVRDWFAGIQDELPPGADGEFDFAKQPVLDYLGTDGSEIHRDFCMLAMRSAAKWAILPMQDVLGKGFRMNTPGTVDGNWRWRLTEELITANLMEWLRGLTEQYGRC